MEVDATLLITGCFMRTILSHFFFYFVQQEEQKEDFSHLPPSQQEKQLKLKIDELKSSYAKELAAKYGWNCLLLYAAPPCCRRHKAMM